MSLFNNPNCHIDDHNGNKCLHFFVSSFYLMCFVFISYVYLYNVLHSVLNKSIHQARIWSILWTLQGWRWAFYISGWPGIFLAALIMYSLREPHRRTERQDRDVTYRKSVNSRREQLGWCERLTDILQPFTQPSVLLLCLAGSVRNTGNILFETNFIITQLAMFDLLLHFDHHQELNVQWSSNTNQP